jgi:hypothetical protein
MPHFGESLRSFEDMGDYKSAKDGYQKALEIARNISEKTMFNMPLTLGNLSGVL